jgi:hypothetical protein
VGHCWMVDPIARTLEVLRLESGRWTIVAVHAGPEVVRAEPFDGVDLDLSLLWDEARPPVIADPSTPMAEK